MDMRPQAHEIIRTWLFSTIVRSELEHGRLPWTDAAISGWVLDPDRKKISKSKGNVVTPLPLLETHGSDGVRYWAASGRPGVDTAVDEGQMKVGRRLAIKILNASRFALSRIAGGELPGPEAVTAPIDMAMLGALARVVDAVSYTHLDVYKRQLPGHVGDAPVLLVGPGDDPVVDVGDVGDVAHLETGEFEVAAEDVEGQGEPAVADVGDVVDGEATDVHRDVAGVPQGQRLDGARGRVVEAQHSGTVTRP